MKTTSKNTTLDPELKMVQQSNFEFSKIRDLILEKKSSFTHKFEDFKNSYHQYSKRIKLKADKTKADFIELKDRIKGLQSEFMVNKKRSIKSFISQKKKIVNAIIGLQEFVKTNPMLIKYLTNIMKALDRLRMKIEAIFEKLKPVKTEVQEKVSSKSKSLKENIAPYAQRIRERRDELQKELMSVFGQFRRSLVKA